MQRMNKTKPLLPVAGCLGLAGLLFAASAAFSPLPAAGPSAAELFKDADLPLGEKLMAENRCAACHIEKFGGDGTSIYRPQGRINAPNFLRGMVEQCNTELNLGLFPEEVTAIAAVLNRDHYRFK
jgi:mono/diheme cytochrome c family protein